MKCEVATITPQVASELLKTNTGNRKLMKSHVAFFEEQLKRGEMQLTHQGIAISITNRLLDGQHRLTAIVNTGISATMLVATGLPDESFAVLDTGSARSSADVLSAEGIKNSCAIAAGIRCYLAFMSIPSHVWNGAFYKKAGTTTAVKAEYHKDAESWTWAANMAKTYALTRVVIPGPMACLMYVITTKKGFGRIYAQDFLATLKEGSNLLPGHPILAYRNRAITANIRIDTQGWLADYIKLFNACATGQQLKIFKSQQYPPMPYLIHASECIHENAAQ